MGKQIRFYMDALDEDEFIEFAHASDDVFLLAKTSDGPLPVGFKSFRDPGAEVLNGSCHLWNRSRSPTPLYRHIAATKNYWLDFTESEVINVIRSRRVGNRLTMGRLHIDNRLDLPDGRTALKSAPFLEWYESLVRRIRRKRAARANGAYLFRSAQELAATGVEFVGHWA